MMVMAAAMMMVGGMVAATAMEAVTMTTIKKALQ